MLPPGVWIPRNRHGSGLLQTSFCRVTSNAVESARMVALRPATGLAALAHLDVLQQRRVEAQVALLGDERLARRRVRPEVQ